MFRVCDDDVIVTLTLVLSDPLPIFNEEVATCKQAILAEMITLPVG